MAFYFPLHNELVPASCPPGSAEAVTVDGPPGRPWIQIRRLLRRRIEIRGVGVGG